MPLLYRRLLVWTALVVGGVAGDLKLIAAERTATALPEPLKSAPANLRGMPRTLVPKVSSDSWFFMHRFHLQFGLAMRERKQAL